jgi:hypothetical protein
MSMTWRFLKPERARSLRSSQPRPPAPTTSTSTKLPMRSRSCRHDAAKRIQMGRARNREEEKRKRGAGVVGKWWRRRLTPGLGSKVEWTRLPGRERSMSRSLHLSGSVGGGAAASGEAISPDGFGRDGGRICRSRGG